MATRLIRHLGEGGHSSCVISVGSWVVHKRRALVLNSPRHLEACWRQLWDSEHGYFLCGLQLYESRHDLTSLFTGENPQLYTKNSLVDCQHEHALVPSCQHEHALVPSI